MAIAVDLAQSSGNLMPEVAARTSLGDVNEMMGRLHAAEATYKVVFILRYRTDG